MNKHLNKMVQMCPKYIKQNKYKFIVSLLFLFLFQYLNGNIKLTQTLKSFYDSSVEDFNSKIGKRNDNEIYLDDNIFGTIDTFKTSYNYGDYTVFDTIYLDKAQGNRVNFIDLILEYKDLIKKEIRACKIKKVNKLGIGSVQLAGSNKYTIKNVICENINP